MAYTRLASFNWGSSPKIPITFSYDRRRSGTAMQYRVKIEIGAVQGASSFGYRIGTTITVNNTAAVTNYEIKANSPSQWGTVLSYESGWITVSNKLSGTTPLKITLHTNAPRGNASYSYTMAVDPGKSTLTVPTFTIGTTGAFTVTKYNTNFTHTIKYKFGNASGTICTKSSATSISWVPPLSLYLQILGKAYGTGTVTIETFSGTTSLGSNSYNLRINAASVYNPPAISGFSYERGTLVDSVWAPAQDGGDIKLSFTAALPNISGNSITMAVKLGGTSVYTGAAVAGSQSYYVTGVGIDTTYIASVLISDSIGSKKEAKLTIATLAVPMNVNFDLPAVAFGKIAEKPKCVEFASDWNIDKNDVKVPQTQHGTIVKNVTAANTPVIVDVTFPVPFLSAPRVFPVAVTSIPSSVSCSPQNITVAGCQIVIESAYTGDKAIYWLAVN